MHRKSSILCIFAVAFGLFATAALARPEIEGTDPTNSEQWQAYLQLGSKAYAHGQFAKSGRYFELALGQARLFGYADPRLTRTLTLLGKAYEAQQRFDDAGRAFEAALAADQMLLAADHPRVIRDLLSIADLHYKQGHFAESEPYFRRLTEATSSRYGPDHPNTAMTLNDIAVLYVADRRYAEAESLFLRTIEIFEAAAADAFLAMAMDNYAALLESLHRHDEAGRVRHRLQERLSDR